MSELYKGSKDTIDNDEAVGVDSLRRSYFEAVDWSVANVVERPREHALAWLEDGLKERVVGQPAAVEAIVKALLSEKIRSKKRPIACLMFLGPTGVGKTETVEALADLLATDAMIDDDDDAFQPPRSYLRIDCSEYNKEFMVSRLLGSAPGYVDHNMPPHLDKKTIEQPRSVVLFDEIEKAHPSMHDILLQIMSNGEVTQSRGEKVSFRDSIVVMTSNLGSSDIMRLLGKTKATGFNSSAADVKQEEIQRAAERALKEAVRPEFFGRISKNVVFNPLSDEDYAEVLRRNIATISKDIYEATDITLAVTPELVDYIIESSEGRREFGARPILDRFEQVVLSQLGERIGGDMIEPETLVRAGLRPYGDVVGQREVEFRSAPDLTAREAPSTEIEVYARNEGGLRPRELGSLAVGQLSASDIYRLMSDTKRRQINNIPVVGLNDSYVI